MKEVRASIDIGSNTVLLLVAEVFAGKVKDISKRSEITSLGKDLDKHKSFIQESMDATLVALRSFVEECQSYGVSPDKIVATATEASRVAKNGPRFFDEVEKKLGLRVNIITPEAEAFYSTKGVLLDGSFTSDVITIMDIGGASTELIKVNTKDFAILESISMPVGSVRSTQWLDDGVFVQSLQKLFLDFRNDLDKFQTKDLYCVAGTVTSLGNMFLQRKEFIEDDVHGLVLKAEDIDGIFKRYSDYTQSQFLELFPFLGKRSNSIRGGIHLVYHLSHRLFVKELTISTFGLRFGTILEGRIPKEHLWKT